LLAGLLTNLTLALAVPWLSWLWWNPAGWLAAVATGLLLARSAPRPPRPAASAGETALLLGGFALMLAVLAAL
jgi:hypothetical protein